MFGTHSPPRPADRLFGASVWLARLLPCGRLPPREAFQARFLLGAYLLGVAVAVPTFLVSVAAGQWLAAGLIGAFAGASAAQLAALRLGTPLPVLVWLGLATVAVFLTAQCLLTDRQEPGQLPWLLLLPLAALVLADPERGANGAAVSRRPVVLAAVAAVGLGLAVIALKEAGVHFGQSSGPDGPLDTAINFLAFFAAAGGLLYLYDQSRRQALDELAALRRFLAVCSWCRKIRGTDGGWATLESYAAAQATQVTHGICPDCAADVLPPV